ncbi:uncharacterized membrane protein (UPF0136 family) [Clostridium acetobutylicum]|uniref:Predicted membrane protein n=1 Tax=Clostridium acetobutylicum (strain ATCC 824 / DSM 792 / JCM 1419 / IAM 19013 / LMG 5710 / NBRC 13948 / NRRL B-527 / VKM B-1787 / 2291 / W) TaxID=272562 RepID=Q97KC5_CLOAB|nr:MULTISPECIES: hypothetical protein [Clostridium]AAK78970.1 Predicted membrane protein [Clostridium acetobutylicum ATCC 824]ADZ20044.1 membrane protein [Clostridium acetobutylicum EA 2018]AEI31540.1 hypothetical protein SMB_G1011 [Clostridium acetobutylicum DSM 1731]AWV81773.1 hypothetical protein DK921_17095 [Clostridium acetobutylicum]KHD35606.1 membrane protein [Clostridium acetobutylicum]
MNVTTISLKYFFFALTIIGALLSFYYRSLVSKTSPGNKNREKILGNMKDPISWRERNSKLSYISMFWTAVSFVIFLYFLLFSRTGTLSVTYLIIYIVLIAASLYFVKSNKKSTDA